MKTVFINGSPKRKFSASEYFLDVQRFFVRGNTVKEKLRTKNDYERILNMNVYTKKLSSYLRIA